MARTIKVIFRATNPREIATLEVSEGMLDQIEDLLKNKATLRLEGEFAHDRNESEHLANIASAAKLVALTITTSPAQPVERGCVTITDEVRSQLLQAAFHHRKASYRELEASRAVMSPERASSHNALWHEHRSYAEMLEALAAGETPKSIKVDGEKSA